MAILRAGPWGDNNDSFQDEPTDQPCSIIWGQPPTCTIPNYYPVNCADKDWVNDKWKALALSDGLDPSYNFSTESSIVELGDSASAYSDLASVEFKFCYQATDDFSLTLHWSVPGFSQFETLGFNWSYNILDGGANSGNVSNLAGSGSSSIDFPAATFCEVSIRVAFGGFDLRTLSAYISA